MKFILAVASLMLSAPAMAQNSYTIQRPGQLPQTVTPTPNGGAVISNPGHLPTIVTPGGNDSYVVHTPGQLPTIIRRN
jgi:hypothetical protein